jgi:hypothetical protein
VRRGFLDTYPAQTVLARAQNLVSGYATNRALRCRAALDRTYSRTFLDNFVVTMISKIGVQLGSREMFCQLRVAVRPFRKVPLAVISPS